MNESRFSLNLKIHQLPASPGVYLFKNKKNQVIYVGKAANLKKRVPYYFQNPGRLNPRISALVKKIAGFDFLTTTSELEALILEANLIRQYRPKYNVCLTDDKAYPYLIISASSKFPGIYIGRRRKQGEICFGPFAGAGRVRTALKALRDIFPLRVCKKFKEKTRPCLEYQIKKCAGPCAGKINEADYRQIVEPAALFLEGRLEPLVEQLQSQMKAASFNKEYEKAALIRDKIKSLGLILEKQKITLPVSQDLDVIALADYPEEIRVEVIFVRSGRWVNQQKFFLKNSTGLSLAEFFPAFLAQFYAGQRLFPQRIITNVALKDKKMAGRLLKKLAGGRITLQTPGSGIFKSLLDLAFKNLESYEESFENKPVAQELKKVLNLKNEPQKIMAFDISNLSGADIVGAAVTFLEGQAAKKFYRKYIIKSFSGHPDDPKAIEEVVFRRLGRKLAEGERLPDLILIDGGLGQLHAAEGALKNLKLENIDLAALAKKEEKIYLLDGRIIKLPREGKSLKFLQRIRDEAHRFAVSFHRLRRARTLKTVSAHQKFFLVFLLFLALFFKLSLALKAADLESREEKLKTIQKELAEKKAELKEIREKEKNVLSDLLKTKNVLEQTRTELKLNQYRLIKTEQKVLNTKKELEATKQTLSNEWQEFRDRLKDIYKNSQTSYLEVIFGAKDLADFLSRSYFFEKVIAKDIELINRINLHQTEVSQKKQSLEHESTQIRSLANLIETKKNQIQLEVSEKNKIHTTLQKMREEYERQIAQLEESSQQIELLLRQKEFAGSYPEATGQMIWPVTGRISSGFGYRRHPIFRIIKFHSGLDITCPYGYPIKAADGGVVIDARYWGGYGNTIIIDHGNGTSTLYGHLSRFYVSRGQRINKGQNLGLAGSTGWSTGPHLHFEVRRNGTPVNPVSRLP